MAAVLVDDRPPYHCRSVAPTTRHASHIQSWEWWESTIADRRDRDRGRSSVRAHRCSAMPVAAHPRTTADTAVSSKRNSRGHKTSRVWTS